MCSPQTMEMLGRTVLKFLEENRAFTGYDVTIATREREKIQLFHRNVREDIHNVQELRDEVEFGDYMKSQIPNPDGGWVFLYHPKDFDPACYQFKTKGKPMASTSFPQPTAGVVVPVPTTTQPSDSGGQMPDGTYQTDYRNRLMVPTKFLRDIGLKPYDSAYVGIDILNNTIKIGKSPADISLPTADINEQKVERNGDMRLSTKTLSSAGLSATSYKIEVTTQLIEITAQ